MNRRTVEVKLSDEDFEMLYETAMAWSGIDGWQSEQRDRFSSLGREPVAWHYAHAYWFNSYAELILARAFIDALGRDYQVLTDDQTPAAFMIVTNYTSPSLARDI